MGINTKLWAPRVLSGTLVAVTLLAAPQLFGEGSKKKKKKKTEEATSADSEKKSKKAADEPEDDSKDVKDAKRDKDRDRESDRERDRDRKRERERDRDRDRNRDRRSDEEADRAVETKVGPVDEVPAPIVDPKSLETYSMTFGVSRSLNSKMSITTSTVDETGLTKTVRTDYTFASGPTFNIGITYYNPGGIGYAVGGYIDLPQTITAVAFNAGDGVLAADPTGLSFSQYGGSFDLIFGLNTPYVFAGANFGYGELASTDVTLLQGDFKGELGGQAGAGLRIGTHLAAEGSFRLTSFTRLQKDPSREIRSQVLNQTFLLTLKVLFN